MSARPPAIWTIGHSTRSLDDFVSLLRENDVVAIADVRRFPQSKRLPHFNSESLASALPAVSIEYHGFPELGGRRQPRSDSSNTAWINASFRGYADYMETPAFAAGIERLLVLALKKRVALMCAEMLWWSCHRSLIADYLKVRGHEVLHIMAPHKTEPHPYTSAAMIVDGRLSYGGLI